MRRRAGAALLCLVLSACRLPEPPPNVVVVLVDTLRPDYLGCYGHPAALTPFVDGLAARAERYTRAYAASTWTNPSIASLFTSRWQSQHGVTNVFSVLPAAERTLAEILRERGFATAGFLATRSIPGAAGFGQGFDVWQEAMDADALRGAGTQVNARTFEWLDARKPNDRRPLFLYLHYMEPHFPYDPAADRLDAVLALRHYDGEQRRAWDARVSAWLAHAMVEGGARDEDMDVMRDYYLAEVSALDGALRELFDGLERRGVLTHAVVVVTADHGEEFREHGAVGHGNNLYDVTLQVPLIVLAPGRVPRTVDDTVSLLDLAPALLEVVGAPAEPRFEGRSLWPASGRPAYAELLVDVNGNPPPHTRALVAGDRKLLLAPNGEEQFYDLARDPGERAPGTLDAGAREELRTALAAERARAERAVAGPEHRDLDPATRERLRALGYAN